MKDYQFSWQNSFLFVGFIQILSGIPIILFSGPELEKRTSNKFDGFGKIFKSILLVTKNKNAMPYILGYDVWGMLAFPLESDFSRQLYQLFN